MIKKLLLTLLTFASVATSVSAQQWIDPNAFVRRDGSKDLTANWDAGSFQIRAETFYSDVATGTAPLTINSTTLVTNLNADLLDGLHASSFALASDYISKAGTSTTTASIPFAEGLSVSDGLVGTPSISFTDDPNTGIYRVGADNLGITVGGTLAWDFISNGLINAANIYNRPLYFKNNDYGGYTYSSIYFGGGFFQFVVDGGYLDLPGSEVGIPVVIQGGSAKSGSTNQPGSPVTLIGGAPTGTSTYGHVSVGIGTPGHFTTTNSATRSSLYVTEALEVDGTSYLDGAVNIGGALKINTNSTTAFWVEQDGVKDNTFIVDTTNGTLGIGTTPGTASIVTLNTSASGGAGASLLDLTATGTHQYGINQTRSFSSVSGAPREIQANVTFTGNYAFPSPGALSLGFFMNDNRAISTAGTGDIMNPIYLNVSRPSFGNTFSTTKTFPGFGALTLRISEGGSGTATYSSNSTVTYTTALIQSGLLAGTSGYSYTYSGSGTMNHVSRGFSSNIAYSPSVTGGGTYNLNHYGVESKATGTTTGTTYGVAYYANLSGFDTNWAYVNEAAANNYMGQDNSKTYWGTGSGTVAARSLASDVFIQYTGTVWDFDIAAATTEIVFNNSGFDTDFRIESDTNDNMFHLDAGLNAVGIGGAAVSGQALKVTGATTITGTTTLATSLTGAAKLVSGVVSAGKFEKIFYIENPSASDSFPLTFLGEAATISRIVAVTDTGTVTFNIEKRSKTTPYTAGTDINSSDFTATSSALETSSFSSGSVSADSWLWYAATSVASSPTKLTLTVIYNWS